MSLVEKIKAKLEANEPFFGLHFFPPKTKSGFKNLVRRIERMGLAKPLWVNVTWEDDLREKTFELSYITQNLLGIETIMHISCLGLSESAAKCALETAKSSNIHNLLVCSGNRSKSSSSSSSSEEDSAFQYSSDLVAFIRLHYADFFTIVVTGYPEGFDGVQSYEKDIDILEKKVQNGADMVITQFFFDAQHFTKFVDDCRSRDILCPIIPGIMPIQTFAGYKRLADYGRSEIPQSIRQKIEEQESTENDALIREIGTKIASEMCQSLQALGHRGFLIYTMNLERSPVKILQSLGMVAEHPQEQSTLPWKMSWDWRRQKEAVRPIYWANRWRSYLSRTDEWDEFPNGRWGDSRSPAFGDLPSLHLIPSSALHNKEERIDIWGLPKTLSDLSSTFCKYLNGEIPCLPWNDDKLALESSKIKDWLLFINQNGFFTINSQPRICAVSSADPTHGWGDSNGFVYQKAYVEFFTSEKNLKVIMGLCEQNPHLTYQASNNKGETFSNTEGVNAVTWGVFPGKEVLQPTIVDTEIFLRVWKDEAFALWQSWADIYPEGSESATFLRSIQESYFLVNIVDNNFVNGDISTIFYRAVELSASENQEVSSPQ